MMNKGAAALSLRNLSYRYTDKIVLNDIELDIETGKITTIIGPNGCGKTTLLRLASNLTELNKSDIGKIVLNGKGLEEYTRNELAKTVSVLPQGKDTASITVEKLVEHGRFPYLGLSRNITTQDRDIIEMALKTAGIFDLRYKNISDLSGGERQKAYIAMTLAQDTPIIFMDEPTTYLDVNHQYELANTIKKLNECNNKTVIMVLHDIALALQYSDAIVVLNKGKVVYTGIPDYLLSENSRVLEDIFSVKCHKIAIDGKEHYVVVNVE